ncbi:hypothetical protein ACIQ1D_18345 [Lysinibacillus xylanilyticus]|uniref:Uncharacterized protein n=1 Tax=Lysinibacillus xylanilyticus TaxID=582475 RepID=A0A2M9Q5M5_9BACI|nr:hypothetical protein [Lysinibacillus xylanilyticus]PJO43365.1 hypothetical protein CWD94_12485 [Lysinibacillus xylanilyticus]
MKTANLNVRTTPTYSTAIENFRSSKARKGDTVLYELPAEIKKHDIGWGQGVFRGVLSVLSLATFFGSLMFLVLMFGSKF